MSNDKTDKVRTKKNPSEKRANYISQNAILYLWFSWLEHVWISSGFSFRSSTQFQPNPGARALKRDSEQKILNNSFLSDLTGLMDTLSSLYAEPSPPSMQHIHPVLTQLKELRLLYLHGNRVCKLSGNPIVTERAYRAHLIATLPHVKMIDFSAVTK